MFLLYLELWAPSYSAQEPLNLVSENYQHRYMMAQEQNMMNRQQRHTPCLKHVKTTRRSHFRRLFWAWKPWLPAGLCPNPLQLYTDWDKRHSAHHRCGQSAQWPLGGSGHPALRAAFLAARLVLSAACCCPPPWPSPLSRVSSEPPSCPKSDNLGVTWML